LIGQIVAYTIIIINYILRLAIVSESEKVGFSKVSDKGTFIKNNVFCVQFINTGIMVLFINMDKGLQAIGLGFADGKYNDYSSSWYQNTGNTIVTAMVFNFQFPFIEYGMWLMQRVFRRVRDKGLNGYCVNKKITKKKTI
jgi:hypothetical protein